MKIDLKDFLFYYLIENFLDLLNSFCDMIWVEEFLLFFYISYGFKAHSIKIIAINVHSYEKKMSSYLILCHLNNSSQ